MCAFCPRGSGLALISFFFLRKKASFRRSIQPASTALQAFSELFRPDNAVSSVIVALGPSYRVGRLASLRVVLSA